MKRSSSGFTIVEVLLVVGLAVILGTVGTLAFRAAHTSSPTRSASPSPAVTSASPTPKPVATTATATDQDKGSTIHLKVGNVLTITLASTYWTINPAAAPAVMAMIGQPAHVASGNCVAGGGCGTASAQFKALSVGSTIISASRVSCGEALGCGAEAGSWQITVIVSN